MNVLESLKRCTTAVADTGADGWTIGYARQVRADTSCRIANRSHRETTRNRSGSGPGIAVDGQPGSVPTIARPPMPVAASRTKSRTAAGCSARTLRAVDSISRSGRASRFLAVAFIEPMRSG